MINFARFSLTLIASLRKFKIFNTSHFRVYSNHYLKLYNFKQVQFLQRTPNQRYSFPNKPLLSWDIVTAFTSVLIFLGIIEETTEESPLILTIKRGILCKMRKEYHKADIILHSALQMAQELCYTDAETYIFDVMADNNFEKEDYEKAKNLYFEVLSRLAVKENFSYKSEEMVELSIKLAYCFSKLNDLVSAEKGFHFSMDTQLERTSPFWNNKSSQLLIEDKLDDTQKNSLALLGMCYDYYSKHLETLSGQIGRALAFRLKALSISNAVNGEQHEQTLILENAVANLYVQQGDYDKARSHIHKAIKGAEKAELLELPFYYLNMAAVHSLQSGIGTDLATPYCKKSLNFLLKTKGEIKPEELKILNDKSEQCLNGSKFY